jgi:phosphoribosyl-AMP cyclohydrolase
MCSRFPACIVRQHLISGGRAEKKSAEAERARMTAEANVADPSPFAPRGSTPEIEEGTAFAPKFDAAGLITCVVTDARSGELLMVAHMNAQALARALETGDAWFYSRSRGKLWKKGETSGREMRIVEMRVDCDQDTLWLKVEQTGEGACHTGRRSCFYRVVAGTGPGVVPRLEPRDADRLFDPAQVYGS